MSFNLKVLLPIVQYLAQIFENSMAIISPSRGESGKLTARPMHPDWAKSIRDQCKSANVPFFFKQHGEWEVASAENGHHDSNMETNNAHWVHYDGVMQKPSGLREGYEHADKAYAMVNVGKNKAGRLLDGVTHDEYPNQIIKGRTMNTVQKTQDTQQQKDHFLTVVFKVTDKELFKSTSSMLTSAFSGESPIPGATITGMSLDDEMTRCEQLENRMAELG